MVWTQYICNKDVLADLILSSMYHKITAYFSQKCHINIQNICKKLNLCKKSNGASLDTQLSALKKLN